MDLVTVKLFDNSIDAHLVKSKLESEQISCFLFDENIITLNPILNLSVGGIKLMISKLDLEKANLILDEINESKLITDNGNFLQCPNCQSVSIDHGFKSMKSVKGILSLITSFFLMVFPIYLKIVNKCKDCGNEFK